MLGAMSHEPGRQRCELSRHLPEVIQANRNDHAARRQSLTVIEREVKPFWDSLECEDRFIFEIRHQALLKRRAIGCKRFKRYRAVMVRVSKILLGAKPLERELTLR